MNNIITTLGLLIICSAQAFAQQTAMKVKPFEKIVINPFIEVILVQGEDEKVEFSYENIGEESLNAEVRGNTLHVFLEDAEITWRMIKHDFDTPRSYEYAKVKATITFKTLNDIEVRGEETLICESTLSARNLTIRAYGENDLQIADIDADNFKMTLYGENIVRIAGGATYRQTINTYGVNIVKTDAMESVLARSKSFGENRISINATDHLDVTQFGEGEVHYAGNPVIGRKLIFGEGSVRRLR